MMRYGLPSRRMMVGVMEDTGRRPGWMALGLETYLEWLRTLEGIVMEPGDATIMLSSSRPVEGLALKFPVAEGWRRKTLKAWSGKIEVPLWNR